MNKRHYPEQLYRLGKFMFQQIAVARPLRSASLTLPRKQIGLFGFLGEVSA